MKFTLSWLRDHLETNATLEEITEKLVTLGIEIESIDNPAEKLKGFVVADVVECGRHPNADRLSLCRIDAGSGELVQVVCGAQNIRQGMKVAFAPLGVVIPSTGDVLKKGKIRDVESFGMCCSATELELGEESEGILDLQTPLPAGTPLTEALNMNDPVIEVGLTPNRSDCFGVRGIARDLAAAGLGELKALSYPQIKGQFECPIQITIQDTGACPAFRGVLIRDIHNDPSPEWVQRRLTSIGLRPISALVDVTNYITYDLGRPLHVFDAKKIQGNLVVRLSKKSESLVALNGKTYELEDQTIVIADNSGVLSLGGVMGGESTGCTETTTDVLIECALFDPIRIAEAGRSLGLLSDSRTRFERGVDPESVELGLEAAVSLIQAWCGGGSVSTVVGQKPVLTPAPTVTLTQTKLTSLSGCPLTLKDAKAYLEKLGFTIVKETSESLSVQSPSWRFDIDGPEALIEEVLRLYGYDSIPATPLPLYLAEASVPSTSHMAKRALFSRGFNETVTWTFMAEKTAQLFGSTDPHLKLANPISQDLAVMRPSLLANLLEASKRNQDRGNGNTQLFEVGPQFENIEKQSLMASGLRSGMTGLKHWTETPRSVDLFDAKADALAILIALGVHESSLSTEATAPIYYHPGRSGCLKQGNRVFAYFGEIHPSVLQHIDCQGTAVGFEVFLDQITPLKGKKSALQLSPYQPVTRDFAFVVDQAVPADAIVKAVSKIDRNLIASIQIFDVYVGDKLASHQKSLAIQVRLEPKDKTLTDADIQDLSTKIIANVEKSTGGVLRQS